jgi:PAS domain S-box-containing protein
VAAAPWSLSPEYQPDGELSSVKAPQMIDAAMERGSHSFEWTHKKFSGEEFFATVTLTRMIYRGQPLLQATVRDITERKRAEAEHTQLITAIEQSAEAVVITNTNGDIEYVNPAFTWITGYSREEVLGQNPRILKSGKQDPGFYQQLWATILQGEIWHGELINRKKDGSLYTEEMNIAPVRSARGEVTHFIATKQDVTGRKTLEAQLQQAAKMEAIGRLAGGVAHDFNNLLTIINGYAELLLDKFAADNQVGGQLKQIQDAGERAASLTRQLLAFSRRQVLASQVLDLNAVVSNVEKMLRRLIGEDVKLHTFLDPSLGRVKADPGQIEQVIMNLAVNARDAMPSGGNLTLETSNVELDEAYARTHATVKPGPHVMLAVSDSGVGMTPEAKTHIFEPFFTTKEKGKGTGLGLATVYGIVKQSGGSIWVYSELGQGTVFKIYLPTVSESPAARGHAKTETDTASGSETILVVEDEQGVRSLVRLALESSGYKVLEMADAESALAACANYDGPIHLLLTDVVMPQMSGPVVAEKVAALRPGIKVLFMSGYTDDAVVRHGVLSHDMPFIQKPFSPLALRKKIREVLGGK